jgi:hypothetical protein
VIIAVDSDDAGRHYSRQLAARLHAHRIEARLA